MRTPLYCPRCGKRCGSAQKLEDADLVHAEWVTGKHRGESGLTVHATEGRTARLSDPDVWPVEWRCEPCGHGVRLTLATAQRVGHTGRLVCDSMPIDN